MALAYVESICFYIMTNPNQMHTTMSNGDNGAWNR